MATTATKRSRAPQKRVTSTPARKAVGQKAPAKKLAAKKPLSGKPVGAKLIARKAVPAKARAVAAKKPVAVSRKPAKAVKVKLVRVGLALPKHELALLRDLKKRAKKLGQEFKKSEILRAGLAHLLGMTDNVLKSALAKVERVKKKATPKRAKR